MTGPLTPCADCGDQGSEDAGYGGLSYWLADDELWARVVGRDDIALCPGCFSARARRAGVSLGWKALEAA